MAWCSIDNALLLESRVGQRYDAIVSGRGDRNTGIRIVTRPVEGKLAGRVPVLDLGQRVQVKLGRLNAPHAIEQAVKVMSDRQVRRLPVLDGNKRLVGSAPAVQACRRCPTGVHGRGPLRSTNPPVQT
jgi:hypothetical protein